MLSLKIVRIQSLFTQILKSAAFTQNVCNPFNQAKRYPSSQRNKKTHFPLIVFSLIFFQLLLSTTVILSLNHTNISLLNILPNKPTNVTQIQAHASRPACPQPACLRACFRTSTDPRQRTNRRPAQKCAPVMIPPSVTVPITAACRPACRRATVGMDAGVQAGGRGFVDVNPFVCEPRWLILVYFVAKPASMAGNILLRKIVQVPSICFGLWWSLYLWLRQRCSYITILWIT